MKRIILIGGKSGSGKNTIAEFMKTYLENKHKKKVLILGNGDKVREYAKTYFKLENYKADDNGRRIMQGITNMLYDLDPNYFEKVTHDTIYTTDYDVYLIIDWRYASTYTYFKNSAYKVNTIYLTRKSPYNYGEQVTKDKSEQLEGIKPYIQQYVHNESLSLLQLKSEVSKITEVIING